MLYFHLNEMSIQAIHDDLVATLGYKALAYSMVTKYLRTARFDPATNPLNSDASSPHIDDSDKAVLAALEEKPFSSVQELARATYLPGMKCVNPLCNER
jgi:hypothetical protein